MSVDGIWNDLKRGLKVDSIVFQGQTITLDLSICVGRFFKDLKPSLEENREKAEYVDIRDICKAAGSQYTEAQVKAAIRYYGDRLNQDNMVLVERYIESPFYPVYSLLVPEGSLFDKRTWGTCS